MHCGYIVKVNKLRPHGNADRLQIADFFGNETCVPLDVAIGDKGIYFPTDLQLSVAFCEANNLVRKKDDAGNEIGGFLDPDKRNVKTIRLRGEPSDGIYLPISALEFTGVDLDSLEVGATIDSVNGVEICRKYIPRTKGNSKTAPQGNKVRKKKAPKAPLFMEHADTEQLAYNLHAFKPGDQIEITLKMHGTSGRTGYLPVLKGYKRSLLDRILRIEVLFYYSKAD
jgi:RNA ligase (TIGR02306 family)